MEWCGGRWTFLLGIITKDLSKNWLLSKNLKEWRCVCRYWSKCTTECRITVVKPERQANVMFEDWQRPVWLLQEDKSVRPRKRNQRNNREPDLKVISWYFIFHSTGIHFWPDLKSTGIVHWFVYLYISLPCIWVAILWKW